MESLTHKSELPECVLAGCQCSADCRFECAPQEIYEAERRGQMFEYETECGHTWRYSNDVKNESFTTDCGTCGQLLLMSEGKLWMAHKKWNEQNPTWPADGKNTGFVEIGE